jgi:hypothetical protein
MVMIRRIDPRKHVSRRGPQRVQETASFKYAVYPGRRIMNGIIILYYLPAVLCDQQLAIIIGNRKRGWLCEGGLIVFFI